MRKLIFSLLISFCLISAGFLFSELYKRYGSFHSKPELYTLRSAAPSVPQEIIIKSTKIDLPIYDGFNKKRLVLSEQGASYLNFGSNNLVIYAHNWRSLFGNLITIKNGDSVQIKMSNGSVLNYQTVSVDRVDPNETYVLQNTPDQRLTLITCTDFFDSKRLIVTAKPVIGQRI